MDRSVSETEENLENTENILKESGQGRTTNNEAVVTRRIPWCSTRWLVAYTGAAMRAMLCMFHINMAVTMPYMVTWGSLEVRSVPGENLTSVHSDNSTGIGDGSHIHSQIHAEFPWDRMDQCFVVSAYFYGYLVSQIPTGWIVSRIGWKHVVTCSMGVSTALTLVIPVIARSSVYGLIAVRIALGVCAGATVPAMFDLVSKWALISERNKFTSMLSLGQCMGAFVGFLLSGILCHGGFDDGWGSVFYIQGVMGVIFVVGWIFCVTDRPENHPRIGGAERHLLATNRSSLQLFNEVSDIPLRKMLTTSTVWAVFVTHMLDNFTYQLILLYLPLFLLETVGITIEMIGLYMALAFMTNGIGYGAASFLIDLCISNQYLSTTNLRKLFGIIGLCCGGVFIMVPGYLSCDRPVPVILCACASTLFLGVSQGAGYPNNFVDMAPKFSEILTVISSTLSALPAMLTPVIIADLIPTGTVSEWRVVFDTAAACALFAAVIYGVFSCSHLESWAKSRRPGEPENKIDDDDRYTLINGLFNPDEIWP